MDDTNTSGVRKQRPKKDLVKFGEDMMRRDSFTLFLPLQSSAMAKQRQYLTPAIVPDSDDDTPDADITIVAHNSIFDPLDGSQSQQRGTSNSEIEIDELKSERTAISVANLKDTQAKGTTTV